MHVAVCIVGYRNRDDVLGCLAALARSTYAAFEVVVCENGGDKAYEALRQAAPDVLPSGQPVRIILAPRNLGYAGGVNVCMRACPAADAWWVINPDTVPEPQAMGALVDRLARGDCDAVGGVIAFPDGAVESYGGAWNPWLAYPRSIGHGGRIDDAVEIQAVEGRLSYLSGAAMMVSRGFVEVAGLMREDYFLYCEEVEWFLRGAANGLRLGFAPEARVIHHQGSSTGSVRSVRERPRMPVYLDTRNKVLVTRDRHPAKLPVAAVAILAATALRFAKRGAWRQLGYGLCGWWAGVLNERGVPRWAAS